MGEAVRKWVSRLLILVAVLVATVPAYAQKSGAYYWGDGDGSGSMAGPDLNVLYQVIANPGVNDSIIYGGYPQSRYRQDLDGNGSIAGPDANVMYGWAAGNFSNRPGNPDRLLLDGTTNLSVQIGDSVTLQAYALSPAAIASALRTGLGVNFQITGGTCTTNAQIYGYNVAGGSTASAWRNPSAYHYLPTRLAPDNGRVWVRARGNTCTNGQTTIIKVYIPSDAHSGSSGSRLPSDIVAQLTPTNSTPVNFTITWASGTPPHTSIDSYPPSLDNSANANFTFICDQSSCTYECNLDSLGWSTCSSPQGYTGLGEGGHTFSVRAISGGLTDPTPPTWSWNIDTIAPVANIDTYPNTPANSSNASFTFSCNEAFCSFECNLDGGVWTTCISGQSYSGLSASAHTFAVQAIDPAGNISSTPASDSWTIDTTPPVTTINSQPSNLNNQTSATFTFSSNKSGSTFQCSLDSGSWTSCTSGQTYSGLSSGSHSFAVQAIDPAGNISSTPASDSWTIDTTPPTITLDSQPAPLNNQTSATFTFSSDESGSTFQCKLDGGVWTTCVSGQSYSGLSASAHTFAVQAIDPAGNISTTPASDSWTIDTTPPVTTLNSQPATLTNQSTATFTFSSTKTGSTFQCSLDSGSWTSCTSGQTYSALTAGSYTFSVKATDPAGNTETTPPIYTWTIDTTPPVTTIGGKPNNPTNQTSATFTFSSSKTGSTFQCSLDSGAWAACSSGQSYSGLASTSHTFSVKATDPAGNTETTPPSYTWTINTTPPDTVIDSSPALYSPSKNASFTFHCTEASCTFQCQLDTGGWTGCTSPQSYVSLAEGAHSFQVRATDAAGNTDPTPAAYSWTVDTIPPVTTINSKPASLSNQSAGTFTFSASESGCTFDCLLDLGSWGSCISPYVFASLSDGHHAFYVRSTDLAGNVEKTPVMYGWTIDTTPPVTTINSKPANPTNQTSATFTFSANETGSTFQCKLDSGAWTACSSGQSYSALTSTSHTFSVKATDPAGNTETTPPIYTWTIDTTPPVTTINSKPANPTNQTSATFTFSANETGSTFQCKLDTGAWTACSSGQSYSALTSTSHTFSVKATDPAGNTETTPPIYTWTIDTTPPDTVIDTGPSTYTQSQAASFTFHATKASCTFECKLDSGAWAACTSPATYSGLAEGTHTFSVAATDQAGNTDATPATYSWTIDRTPPNTFINSSPTNPAYSSTADFSFSCNETGCTFQCELDSASWAACTSPKEYTGLAAGSHTFFVRATDQAGNVDATPASYTWNIHIDSWTTISTTNAPSARYWHTAVWTGSVMIVWGGNSGGTTALNTGGQYNPTTDTWTPTSTTNAPAARYDHTAVWASSSNMMIVWGGNSGTAALNTGGRYTPSTNSWAATATNGDCPAIRYWHTAVWTGSVMVVWGGYDGTNSLNTGGRYTPSSNTWAATRNNQDNPSVRSRHTALWDGTEMIIWGGRDNNNQLNTGARYNPTTDKWTVMTTTNAPTARRWHHAEWTGTQMVIWGGVVSNGTPYVTVNTGGLYNPSTDVWTATSTVNAPAARTWNSSIWTGTQVVVWGGYDGTNALNTGGKYNPATDSWEATSMTNVLGARYDHKAVWTGTLMLIWGGWNGTTAYADGTKFDPAAP